MRTHIGKALQKRSKAIQRAVKVYNAAALALDPPRATIDWNTVSHYKFLEEFPLLRNTSQDLTGKRWALPAVRETMKQWRRICHAREEIIHCNVEIWRLHTSIVNEEKTFLKFLTQSTALWRSFPWPTRSERIRSDLVGSERIPIGFFLNLNGSDRAKFSDQIRPDPVIPIGYNRIQTEKNPTGVRPVRPEWLFVTCHSTCNMTHHVTLHYFYYYILISYKSCDFAIAVK